MPEAQLLSPVTVESFLELLVLKVAETTCHSASLTMLLRSIDF